MLRFNELFFPPALENFIHYFNFYTVFKKKEPSLLIQISFIITFQLLLLLQLLEMISIIENLAVYLRFKLD